MNDVRLKRLERRLETFTNGRQLVTVTFSDGSRRKMQLADTIPLLQENESGLTVASIEGEPPAGSGRLLELVQALLTEEPEDNI